MSLTTSGKQRQRKDFQLKYTTLGCVKWFNNRSGYGFIVAIGDQANYGDVFVHHSQLRISDPNVYKSLTTGEYVEFEISPTSDGKHKYQANNVTGVYGGKLLCENAPSNRPNPRSTSLESTVTEEKEPETQPKYRILQRPSSTSNSNSPRPPPPPTSTLEPPSPAPQEPSSAIGVSIPRSRKPRQSKSTPPVTNPQATTETPYKNAIKPNSSKKA
jgi:cold shock CspA family protein